jgi:signal transduction histidine kinase
MTVAACNAGDATVNDLIHFAEDRQPVPQCFRLDDLIGELLEPLQFELKSRGISLFRDVPGDLQITADRAMLCRAVANLLDNALEAMPHGGELVITACETDGCWDLEVADSGPGLPDQLQDRIFEPFISTKSHGTGLGLAVARSVAAAHHGSITAANCPEGGAAFTLRIPREQVREAAA